MLRFMRPSRTDRKRMKENYAALHEAVADALRVADPIGLIATGAPQDEYELEVGTILPRLRDARTPDDCQRIIYEEFAYWVGEETAGQRESYAAAARGVWKAWRERMPLR